MLTNFQPYNSPLAAGVLLPKIKIKPRFYKELGIDSGSSNYEFLRRLCWKGIQERGIDKLPNAKDYYARVKYELETFEELGFVEYVLLNWEVHRFCIENGIPKGFGRGSAASSCVLFFCYITDVDPIKYDLFFERFVSKARARKIVGKDGITYLDGSLLADVDSDISYDRRSEVIKFIEEKHKGRTAKILTLGTLSSKLVLRECGKIVDGLNEESVNEISSHVPKKFNIPVEINEGIEESDKLRELSKQYPRTFFVAKKLEGLIKSTGVHASGIAISHNDLADTMPVQTTKDGDLVSGFDMHDVAELAVKFDILGLKTLTVVDDCCKQIGIKMTDLNPEEEKNYWPLKNLVAPQGLFQIETDATFRVCQKVRPKNLEELAAVNAISRPGAIQFVDKYAKYTNTGEYESLHPFLDDVFEKTGQNCLFQEQILRALNKVGFDKISCESARKIIGKKLTDQMPAWKQKLDDMVVKNNIDPKVSEILWKIMEDSANYQFALVHAIAYSMLTYATVYLKFNYPQEFFLSLLKMAKHEQEPLQQIHKISQELPLFGIKLLAPDLSKSHADFSIEGKNIRFGLSSIKGISDKSVDALMGFCDTHFDNKYEVFCGAENSKLSIAVLCGLIQAGCLDSFGGERCRMVLEAQVFHQLTQREKLAVMECGESHNYDIFAALRLAANGEIVNDKGKPVFTEKRLEKLRGEHAKFKAIYDQNIKHKEFCYWYFEHNLLGYSYSYNLRQVFDEPEHTYTPFLELQSCEDGETLRLVGVVTDCVKAKSKKNGEKYLRIHLADEGGNATCLFMNTSKFRKLDEYLEKGNAEPKKDQIVTVIGKKNGDIFFVDKIAILDEVIALKLRDLKK